MAEKTKFRQTKQLNPGTNANDPLYVQLKESIKCEILEGKLLPGTKLPPTVQMAEKYGVCHKTVQLTMKSLTSEGLIIRRPRHGTFVASVDRETLLKERQTGAIALLMQFRQTGVQTSFFYREVIDGVMAAAKEFDCRINFHIYSDFDTIQKNPSLRGFLLMLPSREEALKVKNLGLPTVLLERFHPRIGMGGVVNDEAHGIFLALEHLVNLGHKQILYVHTDISSASYSGHERYKGFKRFTKQFKLPLDGYTTYLTELKERLFSGPPFTAIVTDGYTSTLNTLKVLYDNSIRIPEDVSFVGYDDLELAEQLKTPVTVVKQNLFAVGHKGLELFLDQSGAWRKAQIRIKPELILRESTRPSCF